MAALFYLANWWLHTGHHALLLEHTWTLSLEEHFCFVWPLLLTLLVVAALPAIVVLLVVLVVPHRLPEVWLTGLRSIPGLLSVVVVSGVILAPRSWTARSLSWSPLTWMGRRSYGLYLYHFAILSVFLHQVPYPASETIRGLAGMAVSILAAAASYRWLEKPFLRLKVRIADRSVPTLARYPAPGMRQPDT